MTITDAKRRLSIPDLWLKLELPGEPGSSCRSPFRADNHPSFSIYEDGFRYHDHGEGGGGDAIDFLQRATRLSKRGACRKFIQMATGLPETLNHALPSSGPARVPQGSVKDRKLSQVWNLPKFVPDLRTAKNRWHLEKLAKVRDVSIESVELAYERGLLEFCYVKVPGFVYFMDWCPACREPAWAILDQTQYNVQVRLLHGGTFGQERNSPKAKTWPGSSAKWPIGIHEALRYPLILLVEGGPDLLAALHFVAQDGAAKNVGVVAMMGASLNIHQEALGLFAGKRVRIIPDVDDAGQRAATNWENQLRAVGAKVDRFDLSGLRRTNGVAVKDLNDCCLIHPEDRQQLEDLFTV